MSNESISTSLTGIIQEIQAEVIFRFNAQAGILSALNWKDLEPTGGVTARFPIYNAILSSDVATATEAENVTTNKQVTNVPVDITVVRNTIATVVTDQSQFGAESTGANFINDTSRMFSDALLAAVEAEVVALFSGFSVTASGMDTSTAMSIGSFFGAKATLRSAGANVRDLVCVLSPLQYEGPNGLRNALSDAGTGVAGTNVLSEEFLQQGFVDIVGGVRILVSNEITETTSAVGAMYEQSRALGFASNGLAMIEEDRKPRQGGSDLVATGYWAAKELVDAYGVKMPSLL